MRTMAWKVIVDPSGLVGPDRYLSAGFLAAFKTLDVKRFLSGEPKRFCVFTGLELERQHAHADQVGAVDALERIRQSLLSPPAASVPLAAQSRLDPVPYSLPASTTSGDALFLVFHRRVEDGHLLAIRQVAR